MPIPVHVVVHLKPCNAVRVLDCNGQGPTSGVVAGLEWVAQNYQLPDVASMSLGQHTKNAAIDAAVQSLVALGITVNAAAGSDKASK